MLSRRLFVGHLGLQIAWEAGLLTGSHYSDQDVEELCRKMIKRHPEEVKFFDTRRI